MVTVVIKEMMNWHVRDQMRAISFSSISVTYHFSFTR